VRRQRSGAAAFETRNPRLSSVELKFLRSSLTAVVDRSGTAAEAPFAEKNSTFYGLSPPRVYDNQSINQSVAMHLVPALPLQGLKIVHS
jgi:hypothetical protein